MAAILALSAAVAYGVGDFFGGVAAKRQPATVVVLWSHAAGLALMLALVPLAGGEPTARALAVGGTAGLVGGGAVALFYRGLSVGTMSIVAPVAALLSAAVPVLWGLAAGERPSPTALVGIAVALGAIALVSREPGAAGAGREGRHWLPLALAVGAGVGFGLYFVTIGHAGTGVGVWPLVAARVASVSLFATLGAVRVTSPPAPPGSAAGPILAAGLLDAGANVCFLVALHHGLMSVVAVLAALYPAGTVLLARYVLGERLSPLQRAGLGLAAVAAVLIAL